MKSNGVAASEATVTSPRGHTLEIQDMPFERVIGRKQQEKRKGRFRLRPRDVEIVRAVFEMRLLTRRQVQELLFTAGGRSRCQRRLTLLYRAGGGYLDRLPGRPLSVEDVYCISRRCRSALRLLRSLYDDDDIRRRLARVQQVDHVLDVNWCRIRLQRSCLVAAYQLLSWRDQAELNQLRVAGGLVPDAYFEVQRMANGEEKTAPFFLELERSDRSIQSWRQKLGQYRRYYISGDFQRTFGRRALRVLFVVRSTYEGNSERMASKACSLAEAIRLSIACFAPIEELLNRPPSELLQAEIWHRPGHSQLVALFPTGVTEAPRLLGLSRNFGHELVGEAGFSTSV